MSMCVCSLTKARNQPFAGKYGCITMLLFKHNELCVYINNWGQLEDVGVMVLFVRHVIILKHFKNLVSSSKMS